MYELKQAPRARFAKFSSTLAQFGFVSSPHGSALFIHQTNHGIVLLLLYFEDMIITGNDAFSILELQHYLTQLFEMKDLGILSYFLGIEVSHNYEGYCLSLKLSMHLIYFLRLVLLMVKLYQPLWNSITYLLFWMALLLMILLYIDCL